MNKLEVPIEFSFDIDTGTIELLDNDKWLVNKLIAPEVFIGRYRNYKLDLMDETHIEAAAQQVLKIAETAIKNAFDENGSCVRDIRTEFTTDIDNVSIADVVYPGYTLWYDEYGNICARCKTLIVVDVFTETDACIDDIKLYQALNVVMSRALRDSGIYGKIAWFDFDFQED